MQASIFFVVNNPVDRNGHMVIVRFAGTENYIKKDDVSGNIGANEMKMFRMCGLDDVQIRQVVSFLKS